MRKTAASLARPEATVKTTVNLPAALAQAAKRAAREDGLTFRQFLEAGLRRELAARKKVDAYRYERHTFRGEGVQPGIDPHNWEQIRSLIYEDRGG